MHIIYTVVFFMLALAGLFGLLMSLIEGWIGSAAISLALLAVGATGGLTLAVNAWANYDESVCGAYSDATERVTRFARLNHWEWDCLVQTDDGWVSRDAIVKVDD